MNEPRFGTAGTGTDYSGYGYKTLKQVPDYLDRFGLSSFEYQCGRGVRLSKETADALVTANSDGRFLYSLHAPYYISMSGLDDAVRLKSIEYLLQSAAAVRMLGGTRVIFHCGSCGKQSRGEALAKAFDTLRKAIAALDENGFGDIVLCPETMGKVNQLGSLEEVLALCGVDTRVTPCIDFGHLNARTQGSLKTKDDFRKVLDLISEALPDARASCFHVHFSKIEFTEGGEKRHLTFEDQIYGPDYHPLLELIHERGLTPDIICESAGTQAEDAAAMKESYYSLIKY